MVDIYKRTYTRFVLVLAVTLFLKAPLILALGSDEIQEQSPDSLFSQYVSLADGYQRSASDTSLDSIAQLIIELGVSNNNQSFVHQGYYYKAASIVNSDPQKAIEYTEKALSYFEKTGDEYKAARIANGLGNGLSKSGQNKKAIGFFQQAITYSEQSSEPQSKKEQLFRAYAMTNAAASFLNYGNYDEAANYTQKGMDIGHLYKDTMLLYTNNNLFGHTRIVNKDYKSAILYYKRALEFIRLKRPSSARYVMSGLAGAYMKVNKTDSALYYFEQIIPSARQSNNYVALNRDLSNVSLLYLKEKNYKKAIESSNELLEVAEKINNKNGRLNGLLNLSKTYIQIDNYKQARKNIEEALELLDNNDELGLTAEVHENASKIDEHFGNYKSALHHQKVFKSFADSILNVSSKASINELNITYETKEKEETIKQLELQNSLDKKTFQQRVSLIAAGLISTILLGIVALLMFNRKKLKLINQKDNIEQRLLRSQMNPHFIFNAISSIQNYLYDKNDLKVALTYMSKFAELMRQILENSREETIPLATEIKSLENYLELQQLRYNNSFGYEINIDPSIDANNILVPPLIAQPFVENAIEHGMIYRVENGKVQISVKSNNDQLTLVIEDNGVGFKAINIEPKKVFNKKTSLATKITRERLDLISKSSKKKFDLIIDKLQSGGTIVTIQLPKVSAI